MRRLEIRGGAIMRNRTFRDDALLVGDDLIRSSWDTPSEVEPDVIDASGLYVSPGFIDLQINGGCGIDLQDDPGLVWSLAELLPQFGVTAFLPTMISSPGRKTSEVLTALRARPDEFAGAEPLGAHFEGPMLSRARAGAHPVRWLRAPANDVVAGWSRDAGVAMVTLAPELPGALPIIRSLRDRGIVVSAGHTDADCAVAAESFASGISMVTHLFNAMAPLTHRSPSLVGAALADNNVVVGLIADGAHVSPSVVATVWKTKGPEQLALVTDAVSAMGCPAGTYRLADAEIVSDGSAVRTTNGTFAGSLLTMNGAVRNLRSFTGCRLADGLFAASTVPARVLSLPTRGDIRTGAIADLVLLDDDLNVHVTLCAGEVVFVAEGAVDRLSKSLEERAKWKS